MVLLVRRPPICEAGQVRVETDRIRQTIRLRIRDGRLPLVHTIELWHGRSAGSKACDGCGLMIMANDQMSLICTDGWRVVRLHDDCFMVWSEERGAATDARPA